MAQGFTGASSPLGLLAYAKLGGNVNITTSALVLTATATVQANRLIKITAGMYCNSTVAGDDVRCTIRKNDATDLAGLYETHEIRYGSGTSSLYVHREYLDVAPTAGSISYNIRAARVVGSGTCYALSASTQQTYILIEDIGPT